MSTPGVSVGTMIIELPWYGWMSGLVTAITTKKSATEPFELNHLWPLITYSSPSRTARVDSSVGSEPAVLGSVMEKALRNVPSSSGCNHCSRWSSRPVDSMPTASSSALPESGALLPNTTGPSGVCPRISCISPSFTCPYPIPPSEGGRCAAHSPRAFTSSCRGRITVSIWSYSRDRVSSGKNSSRTKPRIQTSSRSNSGSVEKSQAMTDLLPCSATKCRHPPTTVSAMPTRSPVGLRDRDPSVAPPSPSERELLAAAEVALLDERRLLEASELAALAALPDGAVMRLAALAHHVRLAWCGPTVEVEGIL